ncbi:MAG: thioredoxin family protein [Vampirovibrio sp.]
MSFLLRFVACFSTFFLVLGLSACEAQGPAQTVVPAQKALAVLPTLRVKPLVLFISADLCQDCQRLKPVLNSVAERFPTVPVLELNLNHQPNCEQGQKRYNALMKTYTPMVTPTLIFIEKGGQTHATFLGIQSPSTLANAFKRVEIAPEAFLEAQGEDPQHFLDCVRL